VNATKTVPVLPPGCPVVAGPDYPPQARVRVERYWYCLDRARSARSRQQAAVRARAISQAAGEVAVALAICKQDAPAAHADPLAWADVSMTLAGLAMALDGTRVTGRAEFAAAWEPFSEFLRLRAGLGGGRAAGDEPELSAFTVRQVTMAAAVILGAPW